MTLLT